MLAAALALVAATAAPDLLTTAERSGFERTGRYDEFFHRRHPSWDTAYQRYPVVRVEAAP